MQRLVAHVSPGVTKLASFSEIACLAGDECIVIARSVMGDRQVVSDDQLANSASTEIRSLSAEHREQDVDLVERYRSNRGDLHTPN